MSYLTIEAPIELLESIRSLPGVQAGEVQPIDSAGDVYGPLSERMKRATLALGLLTAVFQTANSGIQLAEKIQDYLTAPNETAVVRIIEPATGRVVISVDRSTPAEEIAAAVAQEE